jgi:DNA-binding transcriptional MerR regulator
MKCIKCIKVAKGYQLDEIRRVTDEDADDRVKGGYWKFIPKSEWKLATRKTKSVQVIEQPTEEVVELSIEEKRLARKKKNK